MNIILFVFFKLRDCGHLRITGLQAAVKLSPKGYLQSQNFSKFGLQTSFVVAAESNF